MPLAETAKLSPRNTLFRRQYQYLLSRIGLESPHLFQFTKKKDRPRGLKTPRTPGTHENLGERFNTKRQTLTAENDTSVLLLWHCRSRAFPVFSAFPAFSNRSFSSGSLFNQPNAPEHGPEFLPSLLAKFRAPYQFADRQRIVT